MVDTFQDTKRIRMMILYIFELARSIRHFIFIYILLVVVVMFLFFCLFFSFCFFPGGEELAHSGGSSRSVQLERFALCLPSPFAWFGDVFHGVHHSTKS